MKRRGVVARCGWLGLLGLVGSLVFVSSAQAVAEVKVPVNRTFNLQGEAGYDNRGDFDIIVKPYVRLYDRGLALSWSSTFICPAGDRYSLRVNVAQQNSPLVPELYGEDRGVEARGQGSGVCTGDGQNVVVYLTVVRTPVPSGLRMVPMTYSRRSYYTFTLAFTGRRFNLKVCRMPACA